MSEDGWKKALEKALDQRDALESELKGAKAVIAALVYKYGPCALSVDEILRADLLVMEVGNDADGFSYRARRPRTTSAKDPK